jgi:hypothetical protein
MKKSSLLFPILTSIIAGLLVSIVAFAWTNPSNNPPSGGGALYYYNGNVGIGTTTPSELLHIYKSTGWSMMRIETDGTSSSGSQLELNTPGGSGVIGVRNDGEFGASSNLGFRVGAANAMVITNSGNVGIGTTAPSYKLQVGVGGDGTSAIANAWNVFSDVRTKTNISKINNALETVSNLEGVKFNWKESNQPSLGFIAQDVEKVIPEIVSTDQNGYKSLDYSKLTAVLVEALKELRIENEALKKRIETLEVGL